jgi:hypothetical protein
VVAHGVQVVDVHDAVGAPTIVRATEQQTNAAQQPKLNQDRSVFHVPDFTCLPSVPSIALRLSATGPN